jgi:16S rRNA (guanine(966)-N(2))-methyltransferase RsmD
MRVIAGHAKGVQLVSPKGLFIRPLSDRAKEALFSLLKDLHSKTFLDLFAGTGQVGIEALSRGVEWAAFVEKRKEAVRTIHENLRRTGLSSRAKVLLSDALDGLRRLSKEDNRFDIIFVGPPQFRGFIPKTMRKIQETNVLERSGLVIAQYSRHENIPKKIDRLEQVDERHYGDTVFGFFKLDVDTQDHQFICLIQPLK